MPEDIIGVIPNSISVPLLLANIIRSQYIGSDESDDTMPYKGIWLMTRKMSKVSYKGGQLAPNWSDLTHYEEPESILPTPVHISF